MIKKRNFRIIDLMLNTDRDITIREISGLYGITERSVRYDIDELNLFFKEKIGKEAIEIYNNKLKILCTEKEIRKAVKDISIMEYSLSEEERIKILGDEIFLMKNEFTLNYLSEKYNLGKTTVRQSLKRLNEIIQEYSLYVGMNNNKGYKIYGNEQDIRKYIINILRQHMKSLKNNELKYNLFSETVNNFLQDRNIEFFRKTVIKILNDTKKIISDEAFETLQFFLVISQIRNSNGYTINTKIENKGFLLRTAEFSKIENILENIENIREKDIFHFVDFFLGSYSYNTDYSYFLNWILIESLIESFVKILSDKLKINLTNDMILRKELLNHLKPAIYRMKNKLKLTESILYEVKETYLDLYTKTKLSLNIISDFINTPFDEEEAAFITVMVQRAIERNGFFLFDKKEPNILIVCGLGYSSSRFLYENINNNFQVNIIDIIPFNQLENYDYLKKADIIISTLDFSLDGIDVITVTPLINKKDILKLRNYGLSQRKNKIKLSDLMKLIKNADNEEILKEKLLSGFGENIYDDTKRRKDRKKSFENLIPLNGIKLNAEIENLEELMEFTGKTMVEAGLANSDYTEELKNQIIQYGKYTLIGSKTILPHGQLLKNVNKTGFSIITLKNEVDFSGNGIKIVICLASRHKDEHLQAILELNSYLKNPDFENEILSKNTAEELLTYLKSLNR